MEPIFNGEDLSGWKRVDKPHVAIDDRPVWRVEQGSLRVVGGPGALEYEGRPFQDFVLQVDVRIRVTEGNGGLFFRTNLFLGYNKIIVAHEASSGYWFACFHFTWKRATWSSILERTVRCHGIGTRIGFYR